MTFTPKVQSLDLPITKSNSSVSSDDLPEIRAVKDLALEILQKEKSQPCVLSSSETPTAKASTECPQTKPTSTLDDEGFILNNQDGPPPLARKDNGSFNPMGLGAPPVLPFGMPVGNVTLNFKPRIGGLVIASENDIVVPAKSLAKKNRIDLQE